MNANVDDMTGSAPADIHLLKVHNPSGEEVLCRAYGVERGDWSMEDKAFSRV